MDDMIWNALLKHYGHNVEIAVYGSVDNPADVCLECMDCNEVIIDSEIYTLKPRSEFE